LQGEPFPPFESSLNHLGIFQSQFYPKRYKSLEFPTSRRSYRSFILFSFQAAQTNFLKRAVGVKGALLPFSPGKIGKIPVSANCQK
jgi:hypothetical protein